MISVKQEGDFSKTKNYMNKAKEAALMGSIGRFAKDCIKALEKNTPVDTGLTAASWKYKIEKRVDGISLVFYNTNIQNGVPIAIILQYGHGTRNGGWVQGRDYINPALRPLFDKYTKDLWREVTSLKWELL